MRAQCIICPAVVESDPDPIFDEQRTQREMSTIGRAIVEHLSTVHKPLADFFTAESMKLFSLAMFAQFKSEDSRFIDVVTGLHAEVHHLVTEKITPGRVPPRTEQPRVKVPERWDKLKLKPKTV